MDLVELQNRKNEEFEFQFDLVSYVIPPGGSVVLPRDIALFGRNKSVRMVNLDTNKGIYTAGIKGLHDCTPLDPERNTEDLVDHAAMGQEVEFMTISPEGGDEGKEGVETYVN